MRKGITGIVSLAIGGMLLFQLWDATAHFDANYFILPFPVLSFFGFVFVGIGLWSIIQDKPETKQTPSQNALKRLTYSNNNFETLKNDA